MDFTEVIPFALFVAAGLSMVYVGLSLSRLLGYLELNHCDRWRCITSGPGLGLSLRYVRYVFSDLESDDAKVVVLKSAARRSVWCIAGVLAAALLLVLFVVVMVLFVHK